MQPGLLIGLHLSVDRQSTTPIGSAIELEIAMLCNYFIIKRRLGRLLSDSGYVFRLFCLQCTTESVPTSNTMQRMLHTVRAHVVT